MSTATLPEIGLHAGIPVHVYHRLPGVSQSQLKILRDKSPAHLRWQLDHPDDQQTPAQRLGAAIHTCVLEPDVWDEHYLRAGTCEATKSDGQRCGNAGRTFYGGAWFCGNHDREFRGQGEVGDRLILSPEDYDTCLAVRDSVAAHPRTRFLLAGEPERSAWWEDAETGLLCKGRFDEIGRRAGVIVDLKTTRDASREAFSRAIYTFGYYIQAAHYIAGAKALGIDADRFGIIAVEKDPPYAVAIYEVSGAALYDGERERRKLLELYAQCEESGEWPGYPQEVVEIDLPVWAPNQIDRRLEEAS